ncbi:copper amine oxidase N-terminal domain-containing protein [Paenibacillus pinistramenti]|uniref:copper amine oxidase N-terminal domain-containing protein n=1 Tax=Paenibacillus pinistramenti TaxID=1768003 RepID=UPI001107E0FB|nr:copper amine oxidase N-terminal domain-containing protein [Paenibacillus pinistramenti]
MRYKQSKHKKFLFQLLASVIVFALLVGSFVVIVDPLQFYRKATFYTPKYSWQERYQNPGLARSYTYDTIVLGSSMTENFLPSEVGEKLGGSVLKLSIEGSTAKEQYLTAKVAFGTGQVKQVLWGLDYFAFRGNHVTDQGDFPYYLYDNNVLNDYKYIFNESNIKSAILALKDSKERAATHPSLEKLYNWDSSVTYGSKLVIKNWESARNNETAYGNNEDPLESVEQSFDDNVLQLVKDHPETTFYFYYPPYSVLRQQVWYMTNPERYENQLEMKRYMYEQLSKYDNVSIYEFQTDKEITYNLDNYKDLSHHSGAINSLIVDEISKGMHQVTADNLEEEIHNLKRQAENVVVNKEAGTVYSLDLKINGEEQSFGFIPPSSDDTLMAPVKKFAELLGASFDYDQSTKKITMRKGDYTAILTEGSDEAEVNGQTVKLAASVGKIDGTMAAPLESVPALFGGTVQIGELSNYMRSVDITMSE